MEANAWLFSNRHTKNSNKSRIWDACRKHTPPQARPRLFNRLPRRNAGSPGPLEVVASQPRGGVHRLADEVQARHLGDHHALLRQLARVDAAHGDFGLAVAFRSVGLDGPAVERFA